MNRVHKIPQINEQNVSYDFQLSRTDGKNKYRYFSEIELLIEKCLGIITSSKTSASLLRMSSGSDWNEGTLRGEIRVRDVSHSHVVRA